MFGTIYTAETYHVEAQGREKQEGVSSVLSTYTACNRQREI